MSEQRRSVEVVNQRGLHARASAKFVNAVAELPEGCSVRVAKGDMIEIIVTGEDAEPVIENLAAMVEDGFGEP